MMQAMKHIAKKDEKWYILGGTTSLSTAMAFDRLRISDSFGLEVAILNPSNSPNYSDQFNADSVGGYILDIDNLVEQKQPFHSGGGWTNNPFEHDFSFDCSGFSYGNGNDDSAPILIRGLKESHIFWQVYASPTGYSATRNKDAELLLLDYRTLTIDSFGNEIGRLRLENQGIVYPYEQIIAGMVDNSPVRATEVVLDNAGVATVRYMLEQLVFGGATTGTLSYTETDRPKSGAQEAIDDYDTLENDGWIITGGRPT